MKSWAGKISEERSPAIRCDKTMVMDDCIESKDLSGVYGEIIVNELVSEAAS